MTTARELSARLSLALGVLNMRTHGQRWREIDHMRIRWFQVIEGRLGFGLNDENDQSEVPPPYPPEDS